MFVWTGPVEGLFGLDGKLAQVEAAHMGDSMIRKLSAAILLASAVAPASLYALGLGELHTRSALNQAFNADIDMLSVKKDEADGIKVKLAGPQAFARAGVERPYMLSKLRFKTKVLPNGKTVIHVTSRDPIREPFLDFLVEVNWPGGRLVREYTVLLDPPVTLARRPAKVKKPQVTQKPATTIVTSPTRVSKAAEPVAGERYGPVRRGDTLWGVAAKTRYSDVSVEQMALAYFETNGHAFRRGDINKLKRGVELTIPTHEKATELDRRLARKRFFAEANAWRAAPGGQVAANASPSGPRPESTSGEQEGGDQGAKLTISAARPNGLGEAGIDTGDARAAVVRIKQELLLAREENASVKLENEGLQTRVSELEEQLTKLNRLITLKNEQLARIQAGQLGLEATDETAEAGASKSVIDQAMEQQAESETQAPGTETQVPAVAGETPAPSEGLAEADTEASTSEAEVGSSEAGSPEAATGSVAESESTTGVETETPVASEQEAAEQPGEAGMPAETGSVAPESGTIAQTNQAAAPKAVEPAPELAPKSPISGAKPGLLQDLMDDPAKLALPAGGAVLALLGIWALMRRRKKGDGELDPESILMEQERTPDTELLSGGVEAPLTNATNETSFLSDFSPSEIDALQEETGEVDPLSEADVYIAYGRYQQAEDLVRDALQRNPGRMALKYKLAEIHFATRDVAAFTALAESMANDGAAEENPEAWARVLSMGKALDPGHPLFANAADLSDDEMAGATAELDDPLNALASDDVVGLAGSNVVSLDQASSRLQSADAMSSLESTVVAEGAGGVGARDADVLDLDIDLDGLAEDELDRLDHPAPVADDDFADLMDEDSIVIDLPDDLSSLNEADSILRATGLHDSLIAEADDKPFSLDEVDDSLSLDEDSLLKGLDLPSSDAGSILGSDSAVDSSLSTLSEFSPPGSELGGLDDTTISPASEMLELDSVIDDNYDDIDEVSTKLDLARAYLEMGDKDGARGILDEVMQEGDDFQKQTAKEIIAELG
ncbi:MAG TPA: hypothetical protein ENJ21_04005 [Chromatiaceae bacterium]|nr:hypothetical protein [Chromatiaceae bacterium]